MRRREFLGVLGGTAVAWMRRFSRWRRYSKATPIRLSLRHTTRQGQWRPSAGTNRVKCGEASYRCF
jgi:hypothetical protein